MDSARAVPANTRRVIRDLFMFMLILLKWLCWVKVDSSRDGLVYPHPDARSISHFRGDVRISDARGLKSMNAGVIVSYSSLPLPLHEIWKIKFYCSGKSCIVFDEIASCTIKIMEFISSISAENNFCYILKHIRMLVKKSYTIFSGKNVVNVKYTAFFDKKDCTSHLKCDILRACGCRLFPRARN